MKRKPSTQDKLVANKSTVKRTSTLKDSANNGEIKHIKTTRLSN